MVCSCKGLGRAPLEAAVASGARTLEALQQCTGAGTECGSCLPILERMVTSATVWRRVRVDRSVAAEGIYQLWLTLNNGTAPPARPGQYLRVRVRIGEEWLVRAYTVTSVGGDGEVSQYEITVKRMADGFVSQWLADCPAEDLEVEISPPRGRFCWPGPVPSQPAVCLVAGIGVTPALAFARHAATIRCPPGLLHLDWSVRAESEIVAPHELRTYAEAGCLSLRIRVTGSKRLLRPEDVTGIAAAWPRARFYVCGPPGYIEMVLRALLEAGVPNQRIQVEDFEGAVTSVTAPIDVLPELVPVPRTRPRAYLAGVLAASLALLVLALPATSAIHAKGPANVGHDTLDCGDCHLPAPGTTRQQLQGRVRYVLGLRETPVHVGHVPVDDDTCAGCHDNPDDRHPIHRFAEPRFAEARQDLGADHCVSCHGEHGGGRVTVDGIGFCVECHAEMEVEDDPASPSHAELVADDRWTTCLGCHDFHGNHVREVPTTLDAASGTDAIELYFGGGPSPYGEEKRVTADRASATPGGTR